MRALLCTREPYTAHTARGAERKGSPETYLNDILADPFKAFTFSVTGAAVYQLGSFGSARKELQALSLTP